MSSPSATTTAQQLDLIISKLDALTSKVNLLALDVAVLNADYRKAQSQGKEIKQVVNDTQLAVINLQTAVSKIRF